MFEADIITPELTIYHQKRLAQFTAENRSISPEGIVFVGDSITEFFPLKKYLGRELPLINRGIAGTDTGWLLAHMDEQILALSPSKIFLMIGINDLGMGYSVADTVGKIAELVSQLRLMAYQADIYVLSVLPVNEAPAFSKTVKIRNNRDIQALNSALENLPGLEFINLYSLFLNDEQQLSLESTTDGLHLSQLAYQRLADTLRPYLT